MTAKNVRASCVRSCHACIIRITGLPVKNPVRAGEKNQRDRDIRRAHTRNRSPGMVTISVVPSPGCELIRILPFMKLTLSVML